MSLSACPFCRALFEPGEAGACPDCDLGLVSASRLPPSPAAAALDDDLDEPLPPDMERLPFTYAGRGRGALALLAAAGLAFFFAPWVHETAPELRTLTGIELAQRLRWVWAAGVADFVLLALVLSRRSVRAMRGARVAVGFLSGIVVVTCAVRLAFVPPSSALRPVRIEWGFGLYATGALALGALALASRFGGRRDDLPSRSSRPADVTLH